MAQVLKKAAIEVKVIRNGISRVLPVISATLQFEPSKPVTWVVGINDPDGIYSPYRNTEWKDWLSVDNLSVGTPSKTFEITIITEDGSKTFTHLVQKTRQINATAKEAFNLVIGGIDFSYGLYRPYQTRPTQKNTTNKNIITMLLTDAGITEWDLNDIPEFPVTQMDIQQEMPINRIQTLLDEVGGIWRMEGNCFIAWRPSIKASPDWVYRDCEHLYSLGENEESIDYFNKVTVCRSTKNAGLAWAQEGSLQPHDVIPDMYKETRVEASFSGPFYACVLGDVTHAGCTYISPVDGLAHIDWFLGETYKGSGWAAAGGPYDGVKFSVYPLADPVPMAYWKAQVTGTPATLLGAGIDMDASYTWQDTDSIAQYGLLPHPAIESNFTPNNTIAEMKARAIAREFGSVRRTGSFASPLNLGLTLQDTIYLDERVYSINGSYNPSSVSIEVSKQNGITVGRSVINITKYEI